MDEFVIHAQAGIQVRLVETYRVKRFLEILHTKFPLREQYPRNEAHRNDGGVSLPDKCPLVGTAPHK